MTQSGTTKPEAVPCDGSELLDHRKLLRESSASFEPTEQPKLGKLNISALLDAAFANDASVKAHFRAALLHYRLAAEEVLEMEVENIESGASSPASEGDVNTGVEFPPGLQPGELLPPEARPKHPDSAAVIAVIDEGLPFAQPSLNAHLASVWVMAGASRGAVPFGAEVTGTDLAQPQTHRQRLLGAPGLYESLGTNDIGSPSGRRMRGFRTHGSSVMAIAVEELGREHPVIGVGFPAEVVRDTSGALLPFFILLGVLHVLARTRALSKELCAPDGADTLALPAVINISYGVLSGPKDGSDPLSRALDALCDPARPEIPGLGPVHIVWPMGNGRQAQSHAQVDPKTGPLSLHLLPDDRTPSYVSLRAKVPDDGSFGLRAALCLPGDTEFAETPANPTPGMRFAMTLRDGTTVHAYFKRETPENGPSRDLIILAFAPTVRWDYRDESLAVGRWQLRAEAAGTVEMFVQRDDSIIDLRSGGRQSRLGHESYLSWTAAGREIECDKDGSKSPIQRTRSFNAFASGTHVWRIGGVSEREQLLAPYSGLGTPGNSSRPKEGDVLAISDRSRVVAGVPVRAFFGRTWTRETGTSVAAPWIARAMAKTMSEHHAKYGNWPDRKELSFALKNWHTRPDPQA